MSAVPELATETPAADTYRKEYGSGHIYHLDGNKVPGVTTIINKGFPKQLTKWAAETVANHAVDHWGRLSKLPLSKRLKELVGAPWAARDSAGVRGSAVHNLAEQLARGETVSVPADIAGYVESYRQVFREFLAIKAVMEAVENSQYYKRNPVEPPVMLGA